MIPSPDEVAFAWAKDNNQTILPTRADAANVLGLSTQVPARMVYYTDGETETRRIGPWNIEFVHAGKEITGLRGKMASLVVLALYYIGQDWTTSATIKKILLVLTRMDSDDLVRCIDDLEYNIQLAPLWMKPVIRDIIDAQSP